MKQPPAIAQWLLGLVLHTIDRDAVLGDLEETFQYIAKRDGVAAAKRWYWYQVLASMPPLFRRSLYWSFVMLYYYLRIAFRNVRKQAAYTFINVTGLAIGIAASLFILLWIQDEVQYNRFLPESDRIHLVMRHVHSSHETVTRINAPKPLAEVLERDYPEIERTVLISWAWEYVVTQGDAALRETGLFVGPTFFDVLPFPFLRGDPATALQGVDGVVISERVASRLFGSSWQQRDDVIGQRVTIDHRQDFTITGVIENIPEQSTMQYDLLLPIELFYQFNSWVDHWGNNGLQLYAKLAEGASLSEVNPKVADAVMRHYDAEEIEVFLKPIEDTYLYSEYENGQLVGGRIDYVRMFAVIALFLLLIAAFNFTNLATARSAKRAREIGVRKATGAHKRSLVAQFLGESMLFAYLALFFALVLVFSLLPVFNVLTGKEISPGDISWTFILGGFAIATIVGLVAGTYPAFYLSSFDPIETLRGHVRQKSEVTYLRRGLVVMQFALSVLLIVATIAVYLQVRFIQEQDIGLDRENVIRMAREGALISQFESVRQELLQLPGIAQVSSSNSSPLDIGSSTGDVSWPGSDPNSENEYYVIDVTHEFPETMKMELVEGRFFSREFGADSTRYMVNEEMAAMMGGDVVGTVISFWETTGPIVGVVKNFDMNSIYSPVEPVILRLENDTAIMYVRTLPGQTREALASLEQVVTAFNPEFPFDYRFLDQEFEETYRSEVVMGQLALVFSIIAIFISCLGLFGLVSYTVTQRTKEVGVRKVLGASVTSLVGLLTSEVTRLVALGIAVAMPVSFWLVHEWLHAFEAHINLGPGIFIGAGVLAISIAWLTVSFQAIRAATADPVRALRYE